jgi:hypothetical protein
MIDDYIFPTPTTDYVLHFLRTGIDQNGDERGVLKIYKGDGFIKAFSTRENHKTLQYSSLRVGAYEMKHDMLTHTLSGTKLANPKPCLRPTIENIKSVLIHGVAKDNPDYLAGCIAPGVLGRVDEFEDSEASMIEIFNLIGTFGTGKLVTLWVLSNATGVGLETIEEWKRTKGQ